ncbi:hypothetical protein K466DRAFT_599438 [Polyporus arcularius HHB13444]|uniref:DUF6535 domain-containing protein n=1 Tax=Polyporus arcularius HHB13444 TaxID=1314778 RepID=A0A5C3PCL6_9APHY|nr:hypothetical protein K466DRAFT_599438 [Polyporus arcularius HHB13444]
MSLPRPSFASQVTRGGQAPRPIVCPFSDGEISHARDKCAHTVQEYCDQMVERWNTEIDMFLVFAGLFSAVLTAFNVQSYALLQQDNSDIIANALIHLSAQLGSSSTNGTSLTTTGLIYAPPPFRTPRYAVWVNALWFSSLICTLSAASVALMVKQWLQQYSLGLSGNSHDIARLRQYRYQSLAKWHADSIIAMLPILLMVSVIMFLAGLIILLWNLDFVVATIATALVSILLLFLSATTLLPAFYPDCFYQSPQALGVFLIKQTLRPLFSFDVKFRNWRARPLFKFTKKDTYRSWHAREKAEVRAKRAHLDRGLATRAYDISLDETLLKTAVIPVMWAVSPECLRPFMEDIERSSNRYEPIMPSILHYMTLAARDPERNRKMVGKLLADAWWPRMEANSEVGELFVRTMAILVSRGLQPDLAFYRVTQTLAYSASDGGTRVKPEVVEQLVSTWPSPNTPGQYSSLIRNQDPKGLPLVFSYLRTYPMLLRYLGRLVVETPHEIERIRLQIDIVLDSLHGFLVHVALTEDLSNLGVILWALRRSDHIAHMVSLKTDASCSPLIPPDILESYQDVLTNIRAVATMDRFEMFFKKNVERLDRIDITDLGDSGPIKLASTLQEDLQALQGDLNVLEKFFWMLPSQLTGTGRRRWPSGQGAVIEGVCDAGIVRSFVQPADQPTF